MNKNEFLAFSLPYGLKLMQSCKYWATPEADRVVLFTGLSEIDNKMPEQYQNIPCEPTVFYRVNENTTGTDRVSKFKPICRPLSDLTKPIEHKGETFVPIEKLREIIGGGWCDVYERAVEIMQEWYIDTLKDKIKYLPFEFIQLFISWYFDIADLISKGEAIDVNTLEENPYK